MTVNVVAFGAGIAVLVLLMSDESWSTGGEGEFESIVASMH